MGQFIKRTLLKAVSFVCPHSWAERLFRRLTKEFCQELDGKVTDKFVELLLYAMDVAFLLFSDYRRNIDGFQASYALCTADGRVATTAVFSRGKMMVDPSAQPQATATVRFTDPPALQRFLFSADQDVLDSLLNNEVEVEGNLNYVYKFGYMARALTERFGIG